LAIGSVRRKGLEDLFYDGITKVIDAIWQPKRIPLLDHLNAASELKDLNVSGFHALKGERNGFYAWTVTRNRRLSFRFVDGDALDVGLEDDH
jgi:proteic killer suppression protein